MTESNGSHEELRVRYVLRCATGEDPRSKARDIAFEQTVELPPACVAAEVAGRVVGRVGEISPLRESHWEVSIAYPMAVLGHELLQLLNVLFGNISLKKGIRVASVEWPDSFLSATEGPPYGLQGLRDLCGVEKRPLLCGALKPVGLSSEELGRLCFALASGGLDIVKDDHGLVNQAAAPFRERVQRCQRAVREAHAATGKLCLYFPNVNGPVTVLEQRLRFALEAGCRGVLLSPLLVGIDCLRWIAGRFDLAILAHPALAGAFFHEDHGIAPELLLGEIFRLAGADGVIYPNAGGRFPFGEKLCAAIHARLRAPLGSIRAAFPVLGGGIDVARVPHWVERYGPDTMFLIGGSLHRQPDLAGAVGDLLEAVRAASADDQ